MRLNDILSNADEKAFWHRYGHLGDAYMAGRRKAENAALDLAIQCQDDAHAHFATDSPMRVNRGAKFAAVGMYDVRYGVQFFAVDYATPEDRADFDQWLKEEA
jgi:hypothetical protein